MNRETVVDTSLDYFGDDFQATTFVNKYALEKEGEYFEESPDDMHRRMAKEFARIEAKYPSPMSEEEIYDLLKGFKRVIPQGSIMTGLGNEHQLLSLGNCFVIGDTDEDTYGNIMKRDEEMAQIMKRRGGVGTDVSYLRPEGEVVNNAAKSSTGPLSFMRRHSNTTREVAQGGRRGALMLSMDVRHPNAEEFIMAKDDLSQITGANISLKLSDEFMECVRQDTIFTHRYPVDSSAGESTVTHTTSAKELFSKLAKQAWKSAEPGVLFWDAILRESPASGYPGFKEQSTNPCGELPLPDGDSCRLMLMNLMGYVRNPFTPEAHFDFDNFIYDTMDAQRLMDDVVDLELEQINKILKKIQLSDQKTTDRERDLWLRIKQKAEEGRRTGLGITALGDMLAALGYTYGSYKSIEFCNDLFEKFKLAAYRSSVEMAEQRGAFPIWDPYESTKCSDFIARLEEEDNELWEDLWKYGRRNIALLTISPAGTTSTMAAIGDYFGTTSGVENAFMVYYKRKRKVNHKQKDANVTFVDATGDKWEEFIVFHPGFRIWMEVNNHDVDRAKSDEDYLKSLVEQSPYHLATMEDVSWTDKVAMQGVIQKHIDHSISVTVNLPNNVTPELVEEVYMTAWESGCKGCTIYRDGSRDGVLTSVSENKIEGIQKYDAPKRPEELECDIHKIRYGGDSWKIVIGKLNDDPYEIFAINERVRLVNSSNVAFDKGTVIKKGSGVYDLIAPDNKTVVEDIASHCDSDEVRVLTRLLSTSLRHGVDVGFIIDQLEKSDGTIVSFSKAASRVLTKYIEKPRGNCPECGGELVFQEGCSKCIQCGHSKCG